MSKSKRRKATQVPVKGAEVNPAHYPPGDLPKTTPEELRRIKNAPVKDWTDTDVDALLYEGKRAQRKKGYLAATDRHDATERSVSVDATAKLADLSDVLRAAISERRKKKDAGKNKQGNAGLLKRLVRRLAPSDFNDLIGKLSDGDRIEDIRQASEDPIDFELLEIDDPEEMPNGRLRYRTRNGTRAIDKSCSFKRLHAILREIKLSPR